MNKNEITKHIDNMICSSIDLKEKTNKCSKRHFLDNNLKINN